MLRICILFCFVFVNTCLYAQHIISGSITSAKSHTHISDVYIDNVSQNYLVLSDSLGQFEIYAHIGDTVLFSSIGFYWEKIIVDTSVYYPVVLSPKVYTLGKVTKYPKMPFKELQQKIMAMPMEKDTLRLEVQYEKYIPVKEYVPGQLSYSVGGAITALYNMTNRHARNRLRAIERMSEAHKIVVINNKISRKLVKDITHLPEKYIDTFIVFCDFSDDFIYSSNQMLIISYISTKLDEFLQKHPEVRM
ncbi:MAG: hypothetical protein R6U95_06865 [Bacteroidales bacterium]